MQSDGTGSQIDSSQSCQLLKPKRMKSAWVSGAVGVAACTALKTHTTRPHLIQPLKFAGHTVSDITPEQAFQLMDEKVWVDDNGPDAYAILTKGTNRIHVETVNQYKAALKSGYSANSTFELTMESFYIETRGVLDFMAGAQTSRESYLGTDLLTELPLSMLGSFGEPTTAIDATIHDQARFTKGKNVLQFQYAGTDYWVRELARGDVDRDGIEDSLIMVAAYSEGSGRFFKALVVTRRGPNQRLQMAKM